MDLDIFNPSRHLRRAVLFWLSMFLSGAAFIVSYLSITTGSYAVFPIVEISFGIFSAYICYLTFYDKATHPLRKAYVWLFMATIISGVIIHPLSHGVYVWANLFPIMGYLILGKRSATIVSPFGLFVLTCLLLMKISQQPLISHAHLLVNFVLCYLCVWAAAHILEVKRTVSETSLGQLASRDALTGVYNRHALIHNFERYRQESQKLPLSLLILDLDHFKQVNDKHGHDVGDQVLAQTAALIDAFSNEHLVYRIGGEEFCIAFHDTTLKQATVKAEQIRIAIENHTFSVKETSIMLTASIGVYQCHHFNSLQCVLKKADAELYRAKKSGRNQVMMSTYSETLTDSV
ncbi:GGDEF domain-containing protein [Vibrio panuliri]|uniref:diguanylate cyclase n=1 Tax=Vibrio panuliri TaxID=1381081 RepID=A0A1Q9HEZ0_9VIBR|nr:GGDEF domain-containing protein [Vibrio panuliri]KAB1454518.1 GGDEF domain-containing protein [Vibrio panuliri]OLQ88302.1 diguanylate cyclase [Vibrio panuliri]OLQ94949.1 diguanylate cyclase [Vibrio panuliri]